MTCSIARDVWGGAGVKSAAGATGSQGRAKRYLRALTGLWPTIPAKQFANIKKTV